MVIDNAINGEFEFIIERERQYKINDNAQWGNAAKDKEEEDKAKGFWTIGYNR
jgi:hypothetical protein